MIICLLSLACVTSNLFTFVSVNVSLLEETSQSVVLDEAFTETEITVVFNQTFIERKWQDYNLLLPSPPSGVNTAEQSLLDKSPNPRPDFDDPRSVARFVLSAIPSIARIYPTEGYYYYRFPLGCRSVSGNIRFTEADEGIIFVGYFDAFSQRDTRWTVLSNDDSGIEIAKLSDNIFELSIDGFSGVFERVDSLRETDNIPFSLTPEEQVVSRVLDESGIPLLLIWNEKYSCFYFVFDSTYKFPGKLAAFGNQGGLYQVDTESRFVFYNDREADRLILVGVRQEAIAHNDYFDGPFDQVPPDLDIKEMIELAYPYVHLQGGIDKHGTFLKLENSRVAISPYYQYVDLADMEIWLEKNKSEGLRGAAHWAAMTYESKRDFHLNFETAEAHTLGEYLLQNQSGGIHQRFLSQGWPANHHAIWSHRWPSLHNAENSSLWPADHNVDSSEN